MLRFSIVAIVVFMAVTAYALSTPDLLRMYYSGQISSSPFTPPVDYLYFGADQLYFGADKLVF